MIVANCLQENRTDHTYFNMPLYLLMGMILKTFSEYPVNLKDPPPLINNQIRGLIKEKITW